jgi:dTDP-glucose pyrophosphorylase
MGQMTRVNLNNYTISSNLSIKDAIKRMDKSGLEICICLDNKSKKVVGLFTEGDFRNAVHQGINLNNKVIKILNKKFHYVSSITNKSKIKKHFNKNVNCIPVIKNKKLIDIIFKNKIKKISNYSKIPVVIMAGGKGTRLDPFTRILPKPLFPLGDKPIILKIIDQFNNWGFKKFYLSIHDKSKIIKAYFKNFKNIDVKFSEEPIPMGTIGALRLLKSKLKKTFVVSNCDILLKTDFDNVLSFHKEKKNVLTIVGSVRHYEIPYGICRLKNSGALKEIDEKPSYDYLVNTGVYIFEPSTIKYLKNKNKMDINDLIKILVSKGLKVGVYPLSTNSWFDFGQWNEINKNISNLKSF